MAETASFSMENDIGCGLVAAFFGRSGFKLRKTSLPPSPSSSSRSKNAEKGRGSRDSKSSRGEFSDLALMESSKPAKAPPKLAGNVPRRTPSACPRSSTFRDHHDRRRHSDASRNSNSSADKPRLSRASQDVTLDYARKLRNEPTFESSELSLTIAAHRKSSNASEAQYRASSGNVMLLGHLGNLKQQQGTKESPNNIKTVQKKENASAATVARFIMGNIVKKPNMYRGAMNKLDPDALKSMGNEKYRQGRLEEALALYNQAIALDSSKAAYYYNKSAALMGLGRLIEAALECREAIRIEPNYHTAHYRLAKLYLRLGAAEKALSHLKNSGSKADSKDIARTQDLRTYFTKCIEAKKLEDWKALLNQGQKALSSGADSAPQIHAMKSEALMRLHRHEEAYNTIQAGPTFDAHLCARLLGSATSAYSLIIRSQAYMAAGRFEDALAATQEALKLDSSDEISVIAKRTKAVTIARSNGNKLFKVSKFSEASVAYTEGLEQEPCNSVLLCNRAACRSKLGQYEKALEDCNTALNVRPSYKKAKLRRAYCNAKMERWEAAIQDYQVLMQENPEDEEVKRGLLEANMQLHKQHNEGIKEPNTSFNLISIASYGHLKLFTNAPGISVVLFSSKSCSQQVLKLMERVSKRFPSVNFFKVDVEESSQIARSEAVTTIPAFKIYKKGSELKEILGKDCDSLESSVKLYCS